MRYKNQKIILLTTIGFLLSFSVASAKNFNIFDATNANNSYFSVNGIDGNVGIGLTNPAVKFVLQHSGTSYTPLWTSPTADIAFGVKADSNMITGMDFYNSNNAGQVRLMARNNANDYIAMNAMGTAASASFFGQAGNQLLLFGVGKRLAIGTNSADPLIFGTSNTERVRIDTAGNVGIGVTTVNDKFTIGNGGSGAPAGSANTGHNFTSTYLSTDDYALTNYGLVKTLIANAANSLVAGSLWNGTLNGNIYNGTAGAGNVGIGTINPGAKLQVGPDGSQIWVGTTGNGRSAVVGSKISAPGSVGGTNGYGAYFAYDSYYDEATATWLPIRSTIGGKWKMEMGYNSGDMRFSYSATSTPIAWSDFLTIKNTGNIGIGTTNPGAKLEIKGGNNNELFLDNDGSQYTSAFWRNNSTSGGIVQLDNTGNEFRILALGASNRLSLGTQASDRMTIDVNGNVGIGTSNPQSKLSIVSVAHTDTPTGTILDLGGIAATSSLGQSEILKMIRTRSGTSYAQAAAFTLGRYMVSGSAPKTRLDINLRDLAGNGSDAEVNVMTLQSNGFVGIGANTINDKFTIGNGGSAAPAGSANTGHNFTSTYLSTDDYALANYGLVKTLVANATSSLVAGNLWNGTLNGNIYNGTAGAGNVGIGTTTPGYKLDIQDATGQAQIKSTTGTNYAMLRINNTGGDIWFGRESSVAGGLLAGSTPYAAILSARGTYPIQFAVNNSPVMTLLSGGNVGIGTTAPSVRLDVKGGTNSYGTNIYGMWTSDGNSLVRNWALNDGANNYGSVGQGTYTSAVTDAPLGSNTMRYSANASWRNQQWIPVDITKTYKVSVWGRTVSGTPLNYLSVTQANSDLTTPANGGWGNPYWGVTNQAFPTTWTYYSMTIGPAGSGADYTWNATTRYAQLGALMLYGGSTGVAEISGYKMEEVSDKLASNSTALGNFVVKGNLGIGTTAPNDKLSIGNAGVAPAGSANTGHNFTSTYLSTDDYALANYGLVKTLVANATSSLVAGNLWNGTLNGNIYNGTAGSGNVGIGIISPASKLHVIGKTQITDGIASADTQNYSTFGVTREASSSPLAYIAMTRSGNTVRAMGIDGSNNWIFGAPTANTQVISNPWVTINTSGNVGIGTTAPNDKLSIGNAGVAPAGSANTGHNFTSTYLATDDYALANYGIVKTLLASATSSLASSIGLWGGVLNGNIYNGAAGAGNVGIGTTAPRARLEVNANNGQDASIVAGNIIEVAGLSDVAQAADITVTAGTLVNGGPTAKNGMGYWDITSFPATITFNTRGWWTYAGMSFTAANVHNYPAGGGNKLPDSFLVEASADGVTWSTVEDVTGYTSALYYKNGVIGGSGKWVRITARAPQSGETTAKLANVQIFNGQRVGKGPFSLSAEGNAVFLGGKVGIGAIKPLATLGALGNAAIGATYGSMAAPASGLIVEGNVGIGTTNPGEKLDVNGKSNFSDILYFGGTGNAQMNWGTIGGTDYGMVFSTLGSKPIGFGTGGAGNINMFIANGGNVGIGTTAPNDKLSIGNSGAAPAGSANTGHNFTSTYLSTDDYALANYGLVKTLLANATSSLVAGNLWNGTLNGNIYNGTAGAGNVGIGTTTPGEKLDIYGGHSNTRTRLYATGFGQPAASNDAFLSLWASEPGTSYTGAGIGNNVQNNGPFGRYNTARGGSYIRLLDNSIVLNTVNSVGTSTTNMSMTGGNVSVYNNLSVAGTAGVTLSGTGADLNFTGTGPNVINTASGVNLALMPGGTGNVGVGTTTPSDKLDVAGAIKLSTNISWVAGNLPRLYKDAVHGLVLKGGTGSTGDFGITSNGGQWLFYNPTGTNNVALVKDIGNVGIGVTTVNDKFTIGNGSSGAPAGSANTGHNYTSTYLATDDYALANYGIVKTLLASATSSLASTIGLWSGTDNGNIWNGDAGAGNVGIGTTTPFTKLQVLGGAAFGSGTQTSFLSGADFQIQKNGNNNTVLGMWQNGVASSLIGSKANDNNFYLTNNYYNTGIGTASTSIAITKDGNVGIGTTNPGYKLDVAGDIRANNDLYVAGPTDRARFIYLRYRSDSWPDYSSYIAQTGASNIAGTQGLIINENIGNTSSNYGINLAIASSSKLFIQHTGNVGIGTTNPGGKLDINYQGAFNTVTPGTATYGLHFSGQSTSDYVNGITWNGGSSGAQAGLYVQGSGSYGTKMYFATTNAYATGAQTRMMIDHIGNVGIGTTAPNDIFSIGNAGTAPAGSAKTGHNFTSTYLSTDDYALANYGLVKTLLASATSSLASSIGLWSGTLNGNIWNGAAGAGNVGIGTNNPLAKLQVNGSVSFNADSTYNNREIFTISRAIATGAGSWVNLGSVVSNGQGSYVNIYQSNHHGGTINAAVYEISDVYYSGATTDWMQVPTSNYRSYTGTQDYAIDVRRTANHGTANLEIRVRALSSSPAAGTLQFEIQTNGTFVADSTAGTGATVSGYLSRNAYQFPVSNDRFKASSEGLFILNTGNIGIGLTNPGFAKLQVAGDIAVESGNRISPVSGDIGAANIIYDSSITDARFKFTGYYGHRFDTSVGTAMVIKQSGNIGIGTTAPNDIFSIGNAGTAPAGSAKTGHNFTSTYLSTDDYALVNYGLLKTMVINTANTATTTSGGDLNMGGFNILQVNKLSVTTIDPLYDINGTKYSTYAGSISGGVKEEVVGKVAINSRSAKDSSEYEKVIDFAKEKEGSDLWVWREVVDFSPENVEVFITPFAKFANTYYSIENNKLIFRSDRPVTISYRLIGSRFDWRKWPTRAIDQTEKGLKVR